MKTASVCVRFFTSHAESLQLWIDQFGCSFCDVYCHTHINSLQDDSVGTPYSSAIILLDPRMDRISTAHFVDLCIRAKAKGIFVAIFTDEDKMLDPALQSIGPNWKLSIQASKAVVEGKVNEILGVIRMAA